MRICTQLPPRRTRQNGHLGKLLEYLMATQHNKTMLNGIQDAEGKQPAELVVSLEDRDECRGRNSTFKPRGKLMKEGFLRSFTTANRSS